MSTAIWRGKRRMSAKMSERATDREIERMNSDGFERYTSNDDAKSLVKWFYSDCVWRRTRGAAYHTNEPEWREKQPNARLTWATWIKYLLFLVSHFASHLFFLALSLLSFYLLQSIWRRACTFSCFCFFRFLLFVFYLYSFQSNKYQFDDNPNNTAKHCYWISSMFIFLAPFAASPSL